MITVLYAICLAGLSVYSYALIDPNITFMSSPYWVKFRDAMVQFGYYRRDQSWLVYLVIVALLFLFHFLLRRSATAKPVRTAIVVGAIMLCSYPFLSHDFFNYMFDAKILTFYHQNPYLHRAMDFHGDPWLRFLQWTHRTYPYGPTFLLISMVPSALSLGKFTIDFVLFKALYVAMYIAAVYLLNKMNRHWAMIFATHPLVIIEGLVNGHNDMIAVCLAIIGSWYLARKHNVLARILFLVSGGIKYTTLPAVVMVRKGWQNGIVILGVATVLAYLSLVNEIQPWYYLTVFILVPVLPGIIDDLRPIMAGLLVSYYPYIRFGGWDKPYKVDMKHQIILVFAAANVLYVLYRRRRAAAALVKRLYTR